MITRCNQCGTKFEISTQLVKAEDPTVRCGECMAIFNARAHLVADKDDVPVLTRPVREPLAETPQPAVAAESESALTAAELELAETVVIDEAYQHRRQAERQPAAVEMAGVGGFDVDSSAADRIDPVIHPIDDGDIDGHREFERTVALDGLTGIEPDYDLSQKPYAMPATGLADGNNALAANTRALNDDTREFDDVTGLPEVELDADASLVPDALMTDADRKVPFEADSESAQDIHRHMREHGGAVYMATEDDLDNTDGSSRSWFWPVLLILAALGTGLYVARDSIAKMDLPLPVLGAFCAATGCELPVGEDLSQLELMRKKIVSHASMDNVLVISVDLINRAPFPQPYPVLGITMANGDGVAVAQRDFAPSEYQDESGQGQTVPAGKPVRISFDIIDPGVDAKSFDLEFK